MHCIAAVLGLVLAAASAAPGQEPAAPPGGLRAADLSPAPGVGDVQPAPIAENSPEARALPGDRPVEPASPEAEGLRFGVSVQGRISLFEADTHFTRDGLNYADVFRTGWGVRGEFEALSTVRSDWWWGAYVGVGEDTYGGGASNTDSLGVTVTPEDLVAVTALVGLKTGYVYQSLFADAHLGAGLAHYQATRATIDAGAGPRSNQDFLQATDTWATELGARFGWGILASLSADLGLGFQVQGGPKKGAQADAVVHPESLVAFYIEFGLSLRF